MKSKFPHGITPFKSPAGWAKPANVNALTKGEGEDKMIIGIQVETDKDSFVIPVIDVRASEDARRIANQMGKQVGSKFMKESFSVLGYSYNVSRK